MSNRAQRRANRRNAQLSTGPKTEAGKAASSMNNVRHGLAGRFLAANLSADDKLEFEQLTAALHSEHNPQTPTEMLLVERMSESSFLSSRAIALQFAALESGDDRRLSLLLRYQTTHDRSFFKSLSELAKLRKEKREQEAHDAKTADQEAEAMNRQRLAELDAYLNAPIPGKNQFAFGTSAPEASAPAQTKVDRIEAECAIDPASLLNEAA